MTRKLNFKIALFLMLGCASGFQLKAQQIMMQSWYWDYPKTSGGFCWADTIKSKARILSEAGINFVWLPPLTRASSGNSSNGYDPKDLFDYGEYGQGPVGFGTRQQLDQVIDEFNLYNIKAVGDLVYNHRDGGRMEDNPGLKNYITSYTWAKAEAGDNPFPSDRFRCIIPVGGTSGNGAGDYYIKIRSASQHDKFKGKNYKLYIQTNRVGWQGLADLTENEPNGGSDCGQASDNIVLGRNLNATTWDYSGCLTDEFKLTLSSSDYNATGDTLYIYLTNTGSGGYSDHRIYGIWSGPRSMDIINDLVYQTYTNFAGLPSGRGEMHWNSFKPNNDRVTNLGGDWDGMYFFYDYDQFQTSTRDTLNAWTKWNWENVGIRGLRMDAVKHFTPQYIGEMLNYMHASGYDPPLVVGEWYSTNTSELSGWITNVSNAMNAETRAAVSPKIFDFTLRESLRKACDDNTFFDTRDIFSSGSLSGAGTSGFNIVTFVNNHDFRDASGFSSLIHYNPILAYTFILTNNHAGVPTIFYPDYFGYPNDATSYYPSVKTPLKKELDQLIYIHQKYILNASTVDALNRYSTPYASNYISGNAAKVLIYQLLGGIGGKDVIVAINFDAVSLKVDIGVNMTNLMIGDKFADILGNSTYSNAIVSGSNQIYIELPARSYSVWIKGDPQEVKPLKPTSMQISTVSTSSFTLNWIDNACNENGFILQRKTRASGTYELVGDTLAANSLSCLDATIQPGQTYYYRITAINAAGNSDFSNEDHEIVPFDLTSVGVNVASGWITNTDTLMEFSINSTDGINGTWISCTQGNTGSINFGAGGFDVWIRQIELPLNKYKILTIATQAAAPTVTVDDPSSFTAVLQNASIAMEYQYDAGGWQDITAGMANGTSTFNLAGVHTLLIRIKATQTTVSSLSTSDLDNTDEPITTWNGTTWNYGPPDGTRNAVINGSYAENIDLECKDLTINPGSSLTVMSGKTMTVHGNFGIISNASGSGSLIDNGTLIISGTKTVQLYIPQNDRYYYVSMPVTGLTASVFGDIAGADKLYYRNTSSSAWVQIINPVDVLVVGRGYATKQSVAGRTINLTGTLNTGDKSFFVTTSGDAWNLIGNPYPSPIDWGTENTPVTGWSKTNIRNTVYIKFGDNFAIWNAAGDGAAINGGTQYIPAMQSFWVKALTGATTLDMNNLVRVHNGNLLLKSNETLCQKLRLKVSRDQYSDEALIQFNSDADNTLDKFDAEKMFATGIQYPQVFTQVGTETEAINTMAEFTGIHIQALGFKTDVAGHFTFDFTETESFTAGSEIFLEDKIANKVINLTIEPTYTFSSEITNNTNRFVLHFSDGTTHYNPNDNNETTGIDLNSVNLKIFGFQNTINVKAEKAIRANIQIYNIFGLEVKSVEMNSSFIETDLSVSGIYLVKVISTFGIQTKKIWIQ